MTTIDKGALAHPNDLIENVYVPQLKMAGLIVTSDYCVSINDNGKIKPLTIKGQRLVLPTREQLSNPNWADRIVFHPGMENFHRGESVVLGRYRDLMMMHFNQVYGAILHRLLLIGTQPDLQKDLTPDQTEFLMNVKTADDKTIERLLKILENTPPSGLNKLFIKMFMKRGATLEGKDYGRAGIVSFPLYEELSVKGVKKVSDVAMRGGDVDALLGLMEYMLPKTEVKDYYSRGTNSKTAPLFDALMRTAMALAEPLNSLIELFGTKLGDDLTLDVSWARVFDLEKLYSQIRMIPMQPGNEGAVSAGLSDSAPHQAVPGVGVATPPPAIQQSPYAAITGQAPQHQSAPVMAQSPMQQIRPPMQQQQFGTGMSSIAQQPNQPVNARNPDGTTNFAALIAQDPGLAAAAGVNRFGQPVYQNQPVNNGRASLSNPVASYPQNNGWGNTNNNSWGQPQQNSWGQSAPQFLNGGYQPAI